MSSGQVIKINLIKKDRGRLKRNIIRVISVILVGLLGGGMGYFYYLALQDLKIEKTKNQQLQEQLSHYKDAEDILKSYQELKHDLNRKNKIVKSLESLTIPYGPFLQEIERTIPPEIVLTDLQLEYTKLQLQGNAPDHSSVARFVAGLEECSRFKSVGLIFSDSSQARGRIMFEILVNWGGEE